MFELKSVEKARLCYDNLKTRAKSEAKVAMFAPKAILSDNPEQSRLKEEFIKLLEEDIVCQKTAWKCIDLVP